jgi:ankyrin repeat protein
MAIASGIDLNTPDQWGNTPIHYAIRRGNLKVLKFLVTNNGEFSFITSLLVFSLFVNRFQKGLMQEVFLI